MGIALVTGSSTGIGQATAVKLAQEGEKVYASVRSEASGQAVVDAAAGLDLSLVIMDVDDDASVEKGIAGVLDEAGHLDTLVNNAGIIGGHAIEETSVADFQRVMNTNTWGGIRCIHAVLPGMRDRGEGCILNVTSVAGRIAVGSQGAYAASKWAMEAITEILAVEAAPFGVRVAAIEPGVIVTPIFDKGMADPPDPDSPFRFGRDRLLAYFLSAALNGAPGPELVAEAIWHAMTTDDPKLRYLVGDDAKRLIAGRSELTDEQWLAKGAVKDTDEWKKTFSEMTGVPIS